MAKPTTSAGYGADQVELVRAGCLSLASCLGDLLDDEIVIVGGLVPSLLIEAGKREAHVGTLDLDLGLQLAILASERYHALAERLRGRGFEADTNDEGHQTRQRWKHKQRGMTIDFLIAPSGKAKPGSLQNLEADLAAIVTPGLPLAFRDREFVSLKGRSLENEELTRKIPVCGAGAFILLKALALRSRGENKDAYDIWYVLNNYGASVEEVGGKVRRLLGDADAEKARGYLAEDFATVDSTGPRRAAEFLSRPDDEAFRADLVGLVARLLRSL